MTLIAVSSASRVISAVAELLVVQRNLWYLNSGSKNSCNKQTDLCITTVDSNASSVARQRTVAETC